ncbi:MAG: stage II sporulation protein M [Kiloniellales bacterium]|nr:stage II sporulation protein M [Kiloniellales bacterium]
MSKFVLRSYEFRREREQTWRELEALIGEAESGGLRSLSAAKLLRLPNLYRATISSLSVARSISLDRNVVAYLESLAARAYFIVYGTRTNLVDAVLDFFRRGFPAAVRAARWHILLAALVMALGGVTAFVLTLQSQDWFYSFVSPGLAGDRGPTATTEFLRAGLYHRDATTTEYLQVFAAFLFTHNAKVGMLCFALGFALGVPTVVLLFTNGLMLGAFAALYESRGLSLDLWGWLLIHGTTELLAVVLCGGAGLVLGGSVAFPGQNSRMENLTRNGRLASRIVIGAVALFFVAGLLEGFARQLVVDRELRYLIASGALVLWLLYFAVAGRRRDRR